ncbi:hypothetical protein HYPSUDRAFT_895522 [Hypholoma sublateritium FD-334 SS-4]|uniref:Uncharacterized protein n=1 Tax=Hypholoma sublateritium (strain FD-334 SS-4) TaxID=945553 RepID=A0A0D2PGV3_HYPSF|nr:hypothetical protein HYPSUDRAFT_895522 [Hypholoma sublateritium FD-334 SS-4]
MPNFTFTLLRQFYFTTQKVNQVNFVWEKLGRKVTLLTTPCPNGAVINGDHAYSALSGPATIARDSRLVGVGAKGTTWTKYACRPLRDMSTQCSYESAPNRLAYLSARASERTGALYAHARERIQYPAWTDVFEIALLQHKLNTKISSRS